MHTYASASCNVTVPHNTIDYGRIDIARLHVSTPGNLPEQTSEFSIVCRIPAAVAMRFSDDDRATPAAADAGAIVSPSANARLGLGTAADRPIGAYSVSLQHASARLDGSPAIWLVSSDDGTTWKAVNDDIALQPGMLVAWSRPGSARPDSASNFVGSIRVRAAITSTSSLMMNREINLNGSAALTLVRQ
ncbi:DUF1120 domain-containing protein [Burkholderia cepacia]|uniref:hypothetical protein n=1 Tax=Burkholderia cepacia TaxID=292 RepID=UPI002ABE2744|nr:hypothetical protein [Burkholderia cepacia]